MSAFMHKHRRSFVRFQRRFFVDGFTVNFYDHERAVDKNHEVESRFADTSLRHE